MEVLRCLSHNGASVVPQRGTKPHCSYILPEALAQLLPDTVSAFPAVPKGEHLLEPRSPHSTPPGPDGYQSCAAAELAWKVSPCTCRDAAGAQEGQHSLLLLAKQAGISVTLSTRLGYFSPLTHSPLWPPGWMVISEMQSSIPLWSHLPLFPNGIRQLSHCTATDPHCWSLRVAATSEGAASAFPI